MIIGIFGGTCVGKSTVADALHHRLGAPVRHCGDAVKTYAANRGIEVGELGVEDHKLIDCETRRMAETSTALILDGTFLDVVLRALPEARIIRLTCSDE